MLGRERKLAEVNPPQAAGPAAPPPPSTPDAAPTTTISINMTSVTKSMAPMPVGLYAVVVEEAEYVPHSEKSGAPYVKFTFKVTDEEFLNRKLWQNCSLQETAVWKLVKVAGALGVDMPDSGEFNLNLDALVGLQGTASVTIGEFNGKPKNEVVEILPAGGASASGQRAPV